MAYIMTERDEGSPQHDSCFPVTEQIARASVEVIQRIPRAVLAAHGRYLIDTSQAYSAIVTLRIRHGFNRRGIVEGAAFTRFILSNQARDNHIAHHEINSVDAIRSYIRDIQEKLGEDIQLKGYIEKLKEELSTSDPHFLGALEKLTKEPDYNDAFFLSASDYYYTTKKAYEIEKIRKMFQIATNPPEN